MRLWESKESPPPPIRHGYFPRKEVAFPPSIPMETLASRQALCQRLASSRGWVGKLQETLCEIVPSQSLSFSFEEKQGQTKGQMLVEKSI